MANHHKVNRPRNADAADAYSKGEFIAACIRTYGFISGAYLDAGEQGSRGQSKVEGPKVESQNRPSTLDLRLKPTPDP